MRRRCVRNTHRRRRWLTCQRPQGITVSLKNGDKVQFQMPRLYAPFGLSGFVNKFGPTKFNLDLTLRGWNHEGSLVNKFYKFLTDLETTVIDHIRDAKVLRFPPLRYELRR